MKCRRVDSTRLEFSARLVMAKVDSSDWKSGRETLRNISRCA